MVSGLQRLLQKKRDGKGASIAAARRRAESHGVVVPTFRCDCGRPISYNKLQCLACATAAAADSAGAAGSSSSAADSGDGVLDQHRMTDEGCPHEPPIST